MEDMITAMYIDLVFVSFRVPLLCPSIKGFKFQRTLPLWISLSSLPIALNSPSELSVLSVKNQGLGGPKELEDIWVLTQEEQLTTEVWVFQLLKLWVINILGIYCKWSKSNSIMKHERNPLLLLIYQGSCWDTLTVRGDSIYFNTWATWRGLGEP